MKVLKENYTNDAAVKCDIIILRQGGFDNQQGENALTEKQHNPFTEAMDTDYDIESGREMKYQSLKIFKEMLSKATNSNSQSIFIGTDIALCFPPPGKQNRTITKK